ncbi:MAG TPA: 16S rRNA (guanine(527)-N(7))-methyltransferase RsmG [Alphaproteobacteria bacterium]|nr:16S rRNA (guanine(527)-N(7))-methyltransferase RsmG [Alphaproteobacteria bacterium]
MDNKEKFQKYADLLREWSKRMNLVAPSTLTDIENRHFKDSEQLASVLSKDVSIIDLGSGAGFPGVVLAILGWNVTCIESVGKKANFLNALKQELDLPNLTVFNGRVEDFIKNAKNTGNTLVFTARAFAPLIKIMDYVRPVKSRLFLLKGREIESEIEIAKKKYKFDYKLTPSKTGDGFIIQIDNMKMFHMK